MIEQGGLRAFNTVWSRPTNLKEDFMIRDYDLLVTALSALNWRKNNGKITLFADKYATNYFNRLNMLSLWDKVEEIPYDLGINPKMYWAGAKLFALKKMQAPCVMMDTDMIVWQNLQNILNSDICSAHSEPLITEVYKPKEYFKMKEAFDFDELSFNVYASNTAILYIADMDFKKYYTDLAIEFMQKSEDVDDTLSYMVFAEQRLLSMCAYKKNKQIKYILEFPKAIGNQQLLTHIWGYKKILAENTYEKMKFCKRTVKRLRNDFYEETEKFLANDIFKRYM
ncbi:DUF6734 family protein [Criibacterium bergeronii]|uniref:DUF6734 family protein n=1 Tax=Criibacterium bergeronii TaxID=1871336 RepID=UPI000828AFD7|nr:DUF6734 family protein [Criibacterium bergeronii]